MRRIGFILCFLSALCAHISSYAQQRAVVNSSTVFLHSGPDSESPLETQELMGRTVEIVRKQGYWYWIKVGQPYEAWAQDSSLALMDSVEFAAYLHSPKYIYTALHGHALESAETGAKPVCELVSGDILRKSLNSRGKAERKGAFRGVTLPDGRKAWVNGRDMEDLALWGARITRMSPEEKVESYIALSEKMLGSAYMWGGMSSKGVDCSGLVRWSALMSGLSLPRNCSQQILCGEAVPFSYGDDGMPRLSCLKRGDLVFVGSFREDGKAKPRHVMIYLGDGKVIHSSKIVRVNSIVPGTPDCYEHFNEIIAVRRISKKCVSLQKFSEYEP